MPLALSTAHAVGLALVAAVFIGFALVSALVIPRRRPDFPGKALPAFVVVSAVLFVAMLVAVIVFGAEPKESSANETAASATTTQPATTAAATTAPATTEAGTTPAPSGADVARGESLAASLGCVGCHSVSGGPGAGPTWKGLAGSQVKLADGSTVTADDQYLLESVANPDKQIVAGYKAGIMSASVKPGSVSQADARALVAYIDSLR